MHNGTEEQAAPIFASYGLGDVPRISDPDGDLYREFGLARGSLGQLAAPTVWRRGLAAWRAGHRIGTKGGDVRRMPGVFLVVDGQIVKAFRHETVAERPDYDDLAVCEIPR